MGGVVFAANGASGLGKFGSVITLAAGPVPPGTWILQQAGTLTVSTGPTTTTTITVPLGTMVESDGKNLATGAGGGVRLGAGPVGTWPWPAAWPLTGTQAFDAPIAIEAQKGDVKAPAEHQPAQHQAAQHEQARAQPQGQAHKPTK